MLSSWNLSIIVQLLNHLFFFQSSIDFVVSLFLLLTSLFMRNAEKLHSDGWLAELQCKMWNSRIFLFAPMFSSTYNLVCFTIER